MPLDRLEITRRDRGVQRQLRTGATTPFPEKLSDSFVVVSQRNIERSFVHFRGGVDVGAGFDDGRNYSSVSVFCSDVQRSPLVGESYVHFGSVAQYLRDLGGVAGLDCLAEYFSVDHSAEA